MSFTLSDFINIFAEFKKKILIVAIICALITTVLVFFVIKPVYLASGTVKASSKASGLSGLLSGGIPDIGDIGDLTSGAGGAGKELALYENILSSRKCLEETIIKFKLNDDWEFKYMQDAIKSFREDVLYIKRDKIAGTMEIGVYDTNPQRAKEVTDFLIIQLNKINIELNVLNARNNRIFVQERYELAQKDLKSAEDSLEIFQRKYGIFPDIQVKAAVTAQIQLETEIKSEEVKLDILSKILSTDQPEIKSAQEKISALKQQLLKIDDSEFTENKLNLKGSPEIVLNFLRLQRNVEIQNKVLTFVLPLFEQSKMEERKEMPSVLILDEPAIPERKAKPKRIVWILVAFGLSFIVTYSFFFFKEKILPSLKSSLDKK